MGNNKSDQLHFKKAKWLVVNLNSEALHGLPCAQKDTYNVSNSKTHKTIMSISLGRNKKLCHTMEYYLTIKRSKLDVNIQKQRQSSKDNGERVSYRMIHSCSLKHKLSVNT